MAGEKIAQLIKNAQGNEQDYSDILFGQVTGVDPLKINVENRFDVTQQHLVLSKTVQEYSVNIEIPTVSATTNDIVQPPVIENKVDVDSDVSYQNVVTGISVGSRQVTIPIFRALQVGDQVSMIRAQKGQLYYVLDRR